MKKTTHTKQGCCRLSTCLFNFLFIRLFIYFINFSDVERKSAHTSNYVFHRRLDSPAYLVGAHR